MEGALAQPDLDFGFCSSTDRLLDYFNLSGTLLHHQQTHLQRVKSIGTPRERRTVSLVI